MQMKTKLQSVFEASMRRFAAASVHDPELPLRLDQSYNAMDLVELNRLVWLLNSSRRTANVSEGDAWLVDRSIRVVLNEGDDEGAVFVRELIDSADSAKAGYEVVLARARHP